MVAAFLFEVIQKPFEHCKFRRIYRDDDFDIFIGKWSVRDVVKWLEDFQLNVNQIAGNKFLKFTAMIWEEGLLKKGVEKIFIHNKTSFPYLDMSLYWSACSRLATRVYRKPLQELKYIPWGSTHTPACLHAIPKGVFHRLAKLTSVDNNLLDVKVNEVYLDYMRALLKANLIQDSNIPTFGSLWQLRDD